MPAARTTRQPRQHRAVLLATLLLASSVAGAQGHGPLQTRLSEIREINRFVPERALPMLLKIEQAGGIACHTGRHSCFFQKFDGEDWQAVEPVLQDPETIYTNTKKTHE